MLSTEEKHTKPDILEVTEEVLQAHRIEWDSKISKISQEELNEILGDIRKLRKRKGKAMENQMKMNYLSWKVQKNLQLVRHRFKYTSIRAGVLEGFYSC
jgi:hypothetical protein